jgi:hypothetical protein
MAGSGLEAPPPLAFLTDAGSTSISDCKCAQGFYKKDGACSQCPGFGAALGTTADNGAPAAPRACTTPNSLHRCTACCFDKSPDPQAPSLVAAACSGNTPLLKWWACGRWLCQWPGKLPGKPPDAPPPARCRPHPQALTTSTAASAREAVSCTPAPAAAVPTPTIAATPAWPAPLALNPLLALRLPTRVCVTRTHTLTANTQMRARLAPTAATPTALVRGCSWLAWGGGVSGVRAAGTHAHADMLRNSPA